MESLGARLKREREQRKITLEEISLSTKIGTRFLLAIEEDQFDQLPGGIFNKGFVKAYARSVGVDEAEAVAEYELAIAPAIPETLPASRRSRGANPGPVDTDPGISLACGGYGRRQPRSSLGMVCGCPADCGLLLRSLGLPLA